MKSFIKFKDNIRNNVYMYVRLYEVKTFLVAEFLNKGSIMPHIKNLLDYNAASNDDIAYFTSCSVVSCFLLCKTPTIKKYMKLKKLNDYITDTYEHDDLYKIRHKIEITTFSILLLLLKSPDECF